jgi:prepilin-type N-terminal cleavage/methylation domain-containing protein
MADKKGFTLLELIVVIIIVGACLGFVIPSFINSMEQTKAQAAQNNLYAIAAAQEKFYEDWGSYCISTGSNPTGGTTYCGDTMNDLNANLHLSIFSNDPFSYSCAVSGSYYSCTATDSADTLTLTVTAVGASVSCVNAANPSYCPS